MRLGLFEKQDKRLTDAIFQQFEVPVVLAKKGVAIDTTCVIDQNPETYSPFEGEVVEEIIEFMFKFEKTGKIPKGSVIHIDNLSYKVDRQSPNKRRLRGHSDGDGSTIKVIARPL